MALLDELQLDAVADANEVEEKMSMGMLPPEGMHHAALVGFKEGTANSGSHFRELRFAIIAGPAKGMEVKESLWAPKGETQEKDEKARNRMRLFAHRLGVLKKVPIDGQTGKFRYVPVPGVADFHDVLDKATCVIDVKHEEYDRTDGKGKGKKAILTFEGVLPCDDKRVVAAKVPLGKFTPGAAGANGTANLPPKDNYEGL